MSLCLRPKSKCVVAFFQDSGSRGVVWLCCVRHAYNIVSVILRLV